MDPLSISATCISLIGIITKTSKTVLELLADDVVDPSNESFPETLKKQIAGIVTNCSVVVTEIEQTLKKHEDSRLSKAAQWDMSGKDDIAYGSERIESNRIILYIRFVNIFKDSIRKERIE
jgi:hypothetical protein